MFAKAPLWRLSLLPALITTIMIAADVSSALSQGQPVNCPMPSQLLQFTSAGHVLCFKRSCMYVVAGSHMLRESFVNTEGAAPEAEWPPAKDGRVQPLGKVSYPELWPGITLVYDHPPGGIVRSTYHVKPGADPNQIALSYNVPMHLDEGGNLVFEFDNGAMTACAPIAWQKIEGHRIAVEVTFRLADSRSSVQFCSAAYDPALPLIIDPTLKWNTFIGSASNIDSGYSIAADSGGNVYVSGESYATWGSPVNHHAGGRDAFVTKLNSGGVRQWNTFMGSSSDDYGYAIAVDVNGNIYVAGSSDATWGSPVNEHAGGNDAFAAKLNNSGVLQWNTFMGSSSDDLGLSIAADSNLNVYVTGYGDATWGSPVNEHAGGNEAFTAKLNSSGELQWNTFMGSSTADRGTGIAVEEGGENIYVAGYSDATWGSPINAYVMGNDAFAAKLNSSGVLQWNTFMGSTMTEYGSSIAIDGNGNVYVAGSSNGTWGSPVNSYAGIFDAFAAKLNSSGVLQWNTFMGSSEWDYARAMAVDGSGNVYLTGLSSDTWGNPFNAHAADGIDDAFVCKLSSNGMRLWNTFMGSPQVDSGDGIATDRTGNVFVAGYSDATWGSPINAFAGVSEAFAAKIISGGWTPGIPLLLLVSSE